MTFAVINLVTISGSMHSGRQQTLHSGRYDTMSFTCWFFHLLQAETAISYSSILIKYVVFLKALQPHMGD